MVKRKSVALLFCHTSYVTLNCGFHESAEVAFSGRQNAQKMLKGAYVPLNCGFYDSTEVAVSDRQNAANELTGNL
jgi:hypothetical protein